MAKHVSQILHGYRLNLVFAERETFGENLVFHMVQRGIFCVATVFCLLITSGILLVCKIIVITLHLFFVWGKLFDRSTHLLYSLLLLLLFLDLNALLCLVIETLSLSQLVADHIEVTLHRVYKLSHFLFTDLFLTLAVNCVLFGNRIVIPFRLVCSINIVAMETWRWQDSFDDPFSIVDYFHRYCDLRRFGSLSAILVSRKRFSFLAFFFFIFLATYVFLLLITLLDRVRNSLFGRLFMTCSKMWRLLFGNHFLKTLIHFYSLFLIGIQEELR